MSQTGVHSNLTCLGGIIAKTDPVRYTPAGKAVYNFILEHRSSVIEAGQQRQAYCRVRVVAISPDIEESVLIQPGTPVLVTGFLARERVDNENRLVLHAQRLQRINE